MSDSATVIVRPAKFTDQDLVISSWLQGQYFGSPYWLQMPENLFYTHYRPLIASILKTASVDVAVLSDSPDTVLAYLVYNKTNVFWCYTKIDYRNKGILNILLQGKNLTEASSTSLPGASIRRKKKLSFNPFNNTKE